MLKTNWLDKYKANILSSIRKLRFKYQKRTIKMNVINTKNQIILELAGENNLNMLWDGSEETDEEILFQKDKEISVCLHLA